MGLKDVEEVWFGLFVQVMFISSPFLKQFGLIFPQGIFLNRMQVLYLLFCCPLVFSGAFSEFFFPFVLQVSMVEAGVDGSWWRSWLDVKENRFALLGQVMFTSSSFNAIWVYLSPRVSFKNEFRFCISFMLSLIL